MSGHLLRVNREERAILRMLDDRTRRQQSLSEIARTSRVSKKKLVTLAHSAGIRYRNQHATPDQIQMVIRAVVDQGLTFRAAAKLASISKTAAHRYVMKERDQMVSARGEIQFRMPRRYAPRQDKGLWRCPVHGLVRVKPCVACLAENARAGLYR